MDQIEYCQISGHIQFMITHYCTNPKCRNINKLCQRCIIEGLHKNDEGYSEQYLIQIPLGAEELKQVETTNKEKQNLKYLILIDHIITQEGDLGMLNEDIIQQLKNLNQRSINKQRNLHQSTFDSFFQKESQTHQNIKLKEMKFNSSEVFSKIENKIDGFYANRQQNQQIIKNIKQSLFDDKIIRLSGQDELIHMLNFSQEEEKQILNTINQSKTLRQYHTSQQKSTFDQYINQDKNQKWPQQINKQMKLDNYNYEIIQIKNRSKKRSILRTLTYCVCKSAMWFCISLTLTTTFLSFLILDQFSYEMGYQPQIQLEFEKGDTLNSESKLLYDQGLYLESAESLKNSIKLSKGNHKVYNNLANALFQLGEFEESEKYFKLALVHMKNDVICYNYANTLAESYKYKEAIQYHIAAITLYSDFHQAHFNLALVYFENYYYKEAEKHFKRALQIEPDNTRYLYGVSYYKFLVYLFGEL